MLDKKLVKKHKYHQKLNEFLGAKREWTIEVEAVKREYETALKDKQNKIDSLHHEIEVHKHQIAELREHNKGIFNTIDKKVTGE